MTDKTIWQLAISKGDNTCPVCGKRLDAHRPCTAMITSPDRRNKRLYTFEALYCADCNLPFADGAVGKKVRDATGCWINIFSPGKKPSVESIRNQMYYRKPQKAKAVDRQVNNTAFDLVSYDYCVWKSPPFIQELSANIMTCPKCSDQLREDYTLVPVSEYQKAKIPGRLCYKCKTIYISDASPVSRLMRDNPYTKDFFLNGKALWNASQVEREKKLALIRKTKMQEQEAQKQALIKRRRDKILSVNGSVLMICIKPDGRDLEEHIITHKESGLQHNTVHTYSSCQGRELLSAAFAKERASKGVMDGVGYTVSDIVFRDASESCLPENMRPHELNIQTGGGYYSVLKNNRSEIVDLLLYSSLSQRYEIIRATHEKKTDYCYTDIGLFRQFVREHGNPKTILSFDQPMRGSLNSFDLRSESILMGYGYSVSKANDLTSAERQEILAEIVDLEILEIRKILDLLDFFCRFHAGEKDFYARLKWEEDRNFIETYKANPSRFLIAQVAGKKGL